MTTERNPGVTDKIRGFFKKHDNSAAAAFAAQAALRIPINPNRYVMPGEGAALVPGDEEALNEHANRIRAKHTRLLIGNENNPRDGQDITESEEVTLYPGDEEAIRYFEERQIRSSQIAAGVILSMIEKPQDQNSV